MMEKEKTKPTDISTDAANASASRDSEFHTVSPISPLFEEHTNEQNHPTGTPPTLTAPNTTDEMEVPPPKPPRPISPGMQSQLTLAEAFPTVEASVIKAILIASRGQVEPAFEALLAMTDPSYVPEEAPALPPQPPRGPPRAAHSPRVDSRYPPQAQFSAPRRSSERAAKGQGAATSTPRNQLEADEMYARQLAEHFESHGYPSGGSQSRPLPAHRRQQSEDDEYDSEKEHSFLDDDLPVIKENIRQGFLQTQEKVNKWVTDFKKRLDGDTPSPENSPPPSRNIGSGSGYNARPPARHPRDSVYDADPRVIGDDFAHLELRDNTEAPRRPPRPIANPNLFQQSTNPPASSGPRKVSFQDAPDDDEELYRRSPKTSPIPGVPAKTPPPAASKWEPLKAVEPTPMDGDPFSLGDSEDERERDDVKAATGTTGPQESEVKK